MPVCSTEQRVAVQVKQISNPSVPLLSPVMKVVCVIKSKSAMRCDSMSEKEDTDRTFEHKALCWIRANNTFNTLLCANTFVILKNITSDQPAPSVRVVKKEVLKSSGNCKSKDQAKETSNGNTTLVRYAEIL